PPAPAEPAAPGPGPRPGAPGAQGAPPRAVHADDAPAARTHLRDVDGGHAEKIAAALVEPAPLGHASADLELARALDLVGLDDGGLGGGAAHVDADHVALADAPGQGGGGDDAGRGAPLDHRDGA